MGADGVTNLTLPRLQKPRYIYFGGRIRPWDEGVLHVTTEATQRCLNVFEGIKGYWQPDGSFGILALPAHHRRLQQSARLLYLPFETTYADFEDACHSLVAAQYQPEHDMWVRATLYGVDGHWGEGTVTDLVLTAYHQMKRPPAAVDLGLSTWRRAADVAMPWRIKTGTNYQVARLALIEGRRTGCDEMVLLNADGRVAETTRSCVMAVRDGRVVTPPPSEGALESITVQIVEALCGELGIEFERRPMELSELRIADEIMIVGTLTEVTGIRTFEGRDLGEAPVTEALLDRYREAVTGLRPHDAVELSCRQPSALVPAAAGR